MKGERAVEECFSIALPPETLRGLGSIPLAHVGDAVFELLVRGHLCAQKNARADTLHRRTVALVRAENQALWAEKILPHLTQQEAAVYRRGRNAKVHSVPNHASRSQYAAATALEALLGWLYLSGERRRIAQLFAMMMEDTPCP